MAAEQIVQDITLPDEPPSSTDRASFRPRADTFVSWMKIFATQIASLIPKINTALTWINDVLQTISDALNETLQAKDVTVASANFQGTWSSATAYTIGQSVAYNGNVYRAILASTNQTPTNTTYWVLLTSVKKVNSLTPDASGNVNIEARKGSNIASASTITIGTAGLGDLIHITGTTTITSLGNATAGVMRTIIFDDILTLTHNATSLILPDGANIVTAVGDSAEFVCDTTNNWKLLRYTRATTRVASETVQGIVELATSAEVQAGTDTTRAVTPAGMKAGLNASGAAPIYACRAWVNFNGTGTVAIRASGNVSSITDNGVGDYTVNFATAMPDANYSAFSNYDYGTSLPASKLTSYATSNVRLYTTASSGGTYVDATTACVSIFR